MDIPFDNACFFTGNRIIPQKLIPMLSLRVKEICRLLIQKYGVTDFIAGGALGFDTIAAEIIIRLKQEYNIRLHIFAPCTDQTKSWQQKDIDKWNEIKSAADTFRYINETTYFNGCMHERNRAMVDCAYYGIAYSAHAFGGTYYTVKYAEEKKRAIVVFTD